MGFLTYRLLCPFFPWASLAHLFGLGFLSPFTSFVFPWAFYWLHWASSAQLLHTHPWGSSVCHQSLTLFACIALGLPQPILTFFHITYCPWVCYSLFLSFRALLSPFAFSRSIYLFHEPVIHYFCCLGLMVFFFLCLLPTSLCCRVGLPFLHLGFKKKDPQHFYIKKKKLDGSNVKWVYHHDMLDSWCKICFITYIYDNDG